jgi:endonuclease YncB( thermonuclease family)
LIPRFAVTIVRVIAGTLIVGLVLVASIETSYGRLKRQRETVTGTARAKDGDDIILNGRQFRLDGIDAPEGKQRCEMNCKIWDCGADAKTALDAYLKDRVVTCREVRPFYPGRWIARCEVDGTDLGEWIVRQGWALDYDKYSKGRYKGAEEEAKSVKRGVWRGRFTEPWNCRRVKWPSGCKGLFEGCPIEPRNTRSRLK